jgi:hypothetical protein
MDNKATPDFQESLSTDKLKPADWEERIIDRRKAIGAALAGTLGLALASTVRGQDQVPPASQPSNTANPIDFRLTIPKLPVQKGLLTVDHDATESTPFSRVGADLDRWNRARQSIVNDINFADGTNPLMPLNPQYRNIASDFQFAPDAMDSLFSPFHVEPLIDQAADLLDRCIRDRDRWDDTAEKMVRLQLELKEYSELDDIHIEEEQAGIYDLPFRQSISEYQAGSEQVSQLNNALYLMDFVQSNLFSQVNTNKVNAAYQLSAWLQGLVPYSWQGQSFQGFASATWSGDTKEVHIHHKEAAFTIASFNLLTQTVLADAQRSTLRGAREAGVARNRGLSARADWDKQNVDFQKRRTMVARRMEDIKAQLATDSDGILNYEKRLRPLQDRFRRDFRDAYARMIAVNRGLKLLFNIEGNLPPPVNDARMYDDCLMWCRNTIQHLVSRGRNDISSIHQLSIRDIVGKSSFREMSKKKKWQFTLGPEHFKNMSCVRLRGISMNVLDDFAGSWNFWIQCPRNASITFNGKDLVPLDQTEAKPSLVSRVVDIENDRRGPDLFATTNWYNYSPLGLWTIDLESVMAFRNIEKLQDMYVNLSIAFNYSPSADEKKD